MSLSKIKMNFSKYLSISGQLYLSKNRTNVFINDIKKIDFKTYPWGRYHFIGSDSDCHYSYKLILNVNDNNWISKLNGKEWLSKINDIYIYNNNTTISGAQWYPSFIPTCIFYKNPDDFVKHFEPFHGSK